MTKRALCTIASAVVITCGCGSHYTEAASKEVAKKAQVVGRVVDVHMLGEREEVVTICHVDPRFVVTVETDDGERKLGIHSPARTFMGSDPVGKSYTFYLSQSGNRFLLEKAQEIVPPQQAEGHAVDRTP